MSSRRPCYRCAFDTNALSERGGIGRPTSAFHHVIAFDVAKESLDVHSLPSGESLESHNTLASARRLLRREQSRNAKLGLGPLLVICEATGGYGGSVLEAARHFGLACHRAHGSTVRAYAKFRGRHAKSDPIDGRLIAEDGRDKEELRLYEPPRPEQIALRELVGRRTELQDMIQAEQCRREHADRRLLAAFGNPAFRCSLR